MQFPLDVITGFLHDTGIDVKREPKHPKDMFSWVSALYESNRPLTGLNDVRGMSVYIGREDDDLPASSPTITIFEPGTYPEDGIPAQNENDIYVETRLEPAVLADRAQRYLMGIVQWNDEMASMLDNECICQDLLKSSEPILKCYIGLSDSTYSYIAHTPNIPPIDGASQYFIKNKFYSPGTLRKVRELGLIRIWEHQEWTAVSNEPNEVISKPSLNRVFKLNGAYAAHLIMVSPTPISTAQVFLFDLLAKKVEICLTRHWRLENPLEQRYTYFLKELLTGNTYDNAYIEERARLHGLPLEGLFELCLIDNTWRVDSANYFAKKLLETEPGCKVAFEGSRVAVLICSAEHKRGAIATMESHLFELAHRMHLEVGVSDKYERIDQSSLALEKARIALKYGHRKSRKYSNFDGGKNVEEVFRFRRYFPYFATDPFSRSEKFIVKLLASPTPLSLLLDADRERGTNDYEILRTYLYSEGSIKNVCDIMHMHRNTVNYRLEKIRKTIGGDLDDPDMRMYLRVLYFLSE